MERIFFNEDMEGIASVLNGKGKIFIIADTNVAGYANAFCSKTGLRNSADIYYFHASEENKILESVLEIIAWLIGKEAGRDAMLIGIGGGITTDITGFAASIYKRGIKYALVPTTLLAQADAAVGGKTGVNFAGIKNIVGTFSEPECVYIDTNALQSLSERDFMSGAAEVLKTFIIADAEMYRRTVGFLNNMRYNSRNRPAGHWSAAETGLKAGMAATDEPAKELETIIRRCVEIKAGIVEKDRKEKGLRMLLNLGHTLGHAVEAVMLHASEAAVSDNAKEETYIDRITHGEAVAAGIMAAAEISSKAGMLPQEERDTILNEFKSLGYRTIADIAKTCSNLSEENFIGEILTFVRNDKKRTEDFINFVFIKRIGETTVGRMSIKDLQDLTDVLH